MAEFGIRGSYGSMPKAADLQALGPGVAWVSTLVYSFDQLDETLSELDPTTRVHVVLNNQVAEVGGGWENWGDACKEFARRFAGRVHLVTCGNELDAWHYEPPAGQPDPKLTPVFAAGLANLASEMMGDSGIELAPTSLASSRWPEYLQAMIALCWRRVRKVDLHLYSKRIDGWPVDHPEWQEAREALALARQIGGKPVCSSEAGIKIDDAGGLASQAEWGKRLVGLAADLDPEQYGPLILFAWSDGAGTDKEQGGQAFGLIGPDGHRKPLYYAIQEAVAAAPVPTPPPPQEDRTVTLEDLYRQRWQLVVPALDYHHAFGIETFWREHPELGSPIGPEVTLDDGTNARPFVNGTVRWLGDHAELVA